MSAISGIEGLKPTIEFIKKSKKILIANKEAIICGWDLIKKESQINKTKIVPMNSEHFSIMQLFSNYKIEQIKRIYLTASGGPFLNKSISQLKKLNLIKL